MHGQKSKVLVGHRGVDNIIYHSRVSLSKQSSLHQATFYGLHHGYIEPLLHQLVRKTPLSSSRLGRLSWRQPTSLRISRPWSSRFRHRRFHPSRGTIPHSILKLSSFLSFSRLQNYKLFHIPQPFSLISNFSLPDNQFFFVLLRPQKNDTPMCLKSNIFPTEKTKKTPIKLGGFGNLFKHTHTHTHSHRQ